jgi:hypothetical protein
MLAGRTAGRNPARPGERVPVEAVHLSPVACVAGIGEPVAAVPSSRPVLRRSMKVPL